MGREERYEILSDLEEKLNSKVITLVTGDRLNASTSIAMDILHVIHKILKSEESSESISLFLYSRGGSASAALSLVSLLREFFKSFNVLIPFRAYSAATLIGLGANTIYMCKTGELGPVDVSLTTAFNPLMDNSKPKRPGNILPVNVEDLNGYVDFIKEELDIKDSKDLIIALDFLCEELNPLAIGALHRAREQNKQIAITLMEYHLDDKKKIEKIAEVLTRGLYTHSFSISRNDAKKMGLPLIEIPADTEKLIMDLYFEYFNLLELDTPYAPEIYLPYNSSEREKEILLHRCVVETITNGELESYTFQTKKHLKWIETYNKDFQVKIPNIIERDISNQWFDNNEV